MESSQELLNKPSSSSESTGSCTIDRSVEREFNGVVYDDRSIAEDIVIAKDSSFTSTNSSIFSQFRISEDDFNLDIDNPNLRGLFCHILTKLEFLEDQNNLQKESVDMMKKNYNNKLHKLKKLNDYLTDEIDNIYDEMYSMDTRLVHAEQYSRRESVIISGIPDSVTQAQLELAVLDIIRRLGLNDVSSYCISACHRLYKNKNDKYPARTIVKFTNRKIAEFCLNHRDKLFEINRSLKVNLRFFESMCKANEETLKLCKRLKDYDYIGEYKITNGSIRIKKTNTYKSIKIKHPYEIYEMFKDFFEYEDLYIT